jgi:hypothetical protein
MNQRHHGVNLFGYWFTLPEVRVIIITIVTLIGGLVAIFTDTQFLLPAILALLLATAWHLLFKIATQ